MASQKQSEMSKVINIGDAKAHFSRLIERAAQGEVIVIAKAGTPMAPLAANVFALLQSRYRKGCKCAQ